MNVLYTTESLSTGDGRNGRSVLADGSLGFDMRMPVEMGGSGDGVNPEQLFAVGYAACFHGALRLVAGKAKADVADSAVGAKVSIGRGDDGLGLAVELEIVLPNVDHERAVELANEAHQVCPYSKATRGNIEVTLTVVDD